MKTFKLPFEDFLNRFTEEELDEQIVVVSIIDKTSLSDNCPLIHEFQYFSDDDDDHEEQDENEVCSIKGHFASDERVLYLYLVGPYHINKLLTLLNNVSSEMKEKGYLYCWNNFKSNYGRALLFLFSMSHIMVVCHPSYSPDFSFIQLLKVLSFIRPKYQTVVTNILNKIPSVNHDWIFHGRLCSPRLLFVFGCPFDIINEEDDEERALRTTKLEHALEDQIYLALRKSRLVKNVCNRAFFSIAPNDEFVFVQNKRLKAINSKFEWHFNKFFEELKLGENECEDDENEPISLIEVSPHYSLSNETDLDRMWRRKPGRTLTVNTSPVAAEKEQESLETNNIYTFNDDLFADFPVWPLAEVPAPVEHNYYDPSMIPASTMEEHYIQYGTGCTLVGYTTENQGTNYGASDLTQDMCITTLFLVKYTSMSFILLKHIHKNYNSRHCVPTIPEETTFVNAGLNCMLGGESLQYVEGGESQIIMPTCSSSSSSDSDDDDEDEDLYRDPAAFKSGHAFKSFLNKHIRKAHNDGFYDNMGKYTNMKPFFERPTLKIWFAAGNSILSNTEFGLHVKSSGAVSLMNTVLGTELQFSSARCKKIIPLAVAHYQENLPPHYNLAVHQKQVKRAVDIFTHHARGPEQEKYIVQLKEDCDNVWKNGRQTCEVSSLYKNTCTRPAHQCPAEVDQEADHWNGIQYISSCNCGMKQGNRQDPFTLRAANYSYYLDIGKECGCYHLEHHKLPVFQPSTLDYKPADIQSYLVNHEHSNAQAFSSIYHDNNVSVHSAQTLSAGNISKLWTPDNSVSTLNGTTTPVTPPLSDQSNNIVLNYYNHQQDKQLVRQASTTEYLPGMIHFDSPCGLLPQFPSWSLLCRGPSSLYSHNLGLHDQPGFILGSSYLLPWDVTVREKDNIGNNTSDVMRKMQSAMYISRGGYKKFQRFPKDYINVKIFVGVEYECLRGHRFMSSAPGKILKVSANGIVKENANKITKGNMPLYLPCPCGKTAQLMRIHVVTPKAPVFVTLDPRVRPAPIPCPIFVTGEPKPIPLSQSTYWVLRLPFAYASERHVYTMPPRLKKLKYGELVGPMYGITQIPE